ncbi:MAG: tripartite tricarboxylate transporter permease [Armatimonadota bacterium]|nr:tripartite tricarboxylate transporter permease [Armatimonadota bacterium]MDW8155449.1 tripartite tricarboxylate transporter permease [Armatimonadota bacterium]
MDPVVQGLLNVLSPQYLLLMAVGVAVGSVVGALPGFTATMGLTVLLPFTFVMDATSALVLMGALYGAAAFGDAVPACLIATPGTPAAVATAIEGHKLTKKGKAHQALLTALVASALGQLTGGVSLLLLAAPLAALSLRFGPPEVFWVGVFGLTIMASLTGKSLLKGIAGASLGLLLSTVGVSRTESWVRYAFGLPQLQGGVELVVALIGFFTVPEVLRMVEQRRREQYVAEYREQPGALWEVLRETLTRPFLLLKASLVGIIVGIVPGTGGPIASLVAYNEVLRSSKNREVGKGSIEGLIAPELANNSVAPAAMIPTLTLGIPGSAPAAVILASLLLHGVKPGRELFGAHATMTYTFIWSTLVSGLVLFVVGLFMIRLLVLVIRIPVHLLAPVVLSLALVGSFAVRNSVFDVGMMMGFGILAYVLRKCGFESGPIVLGLLLGPIIEPALITSLTLAQARGSWLEVFLLRPFSALFIVLSVWSLVRGLRGWKLAQQAAAAEA